LLASNGYQPLKKPTHPEVPGGVQAEKLSTNPEPSGSFLQIWIGLYSRFRRASRSALFSSTGPGNLNNPATLKTLSAVRNVRARAPVQARMIPGSRYRARLKT
jgi:hypothetical protein